MRHNGMSNIEFFYTGNAGNLMYVMDIEPMTRIDHQAQCQTMINCPLHALQLDQLIFFTHRICISASVDFDHLRTRRLGCLYLRDIRAYEQ